jgi:hypothetical protein
MSLGAVYGFESIMTRRRRRREATASDGGADEPASLATPDADEAVDGERIGVLTRSASQGETPVVRGIPRIPWRRGGTRSAREPAGRPRQVVTAEER